MKSVPPTRKNKHVVLDQIKLQKAQKVLGAKTETETIERALDWVLSEAEKDRQTLLAHERFLKSAVRDKLTIEDVFGRLDGE